MKKLFLLALVFPSICMAEPLTMTGRFQTFKIGDLYGSTRMIDSQTGKIWHLMCEEFKSEPTDCAKYVWAPEKIEGLK